MSLSVQRIPSVYISTDLYINIQFSESIQPNSLTLTALLDKVILYTEDCHVGVLKNCDKFVTLFGVVKIFDSEGESDKINMLFTFYFW